MSSQQLNSWIDQLVKENQMYRDLNRQLMTQLDQHVTANKKLLADLKECREGKDEPEDKGEIPDGENKWEDFRMHRQKSNLV